MKHLLAFLPFLVLPLVLSAQTEWKIPGAQKQPQWLMPFSFEDANGERDTVWVGYDKNAHQSRVGYDPEFNEWQKVDTSRFQAVICPGCYSPFMTTPKDSAYKADIQSYPYPDVFIGFINGKMPVTMKWDESVLNSDSLSIFFPDISPRPRARIDLKCTNTEPPYTYCRTQAPYHPPIVLTSYPVDDFKPTDVFTDSFFFNGSGKLPPNNAVDIFLAIVPHDKPVLVNLDSRTLQNQLQVYPNPFYNELILKTDLPSFGYTLCDAYGRIWLQQPIQNQPDTKLETGHLPAGMYFLRLQTPSASVVKIVTKTK